ncbi:protein JTB-like isoform X2 [Mizuhopecten yessoensis]|uniref:protein JTB-like isoform X2 n=1 Tax=Mizuhopecten yessoensis TaxID=6573 RepID=UPI000B457A56|nr:protein JTB-like isoform X2 [Mizuhopecten yessoensis]
MIEFCTKKRMLIALCILLSVSFVILLVQSAWSTHHSIREFNTLQGRKERNESCSSGNERVLKACHPCTKLDLRRERPSCRLWGYMEVIECEDKKEISRNCDIDPDKHATRFWVFELVCLLIGIASYFVVKKRQKRLDTFLMEKINKQISEGV